MKLKDILNKAASPFVKAGKAIKDRVVGFATNEDMDVQQRGICGFIGVSCLSATFLLANGAFDSRPAAKPQLTNPTAQTLQVPAQSPQQNPLPNPDSERLRDELLGGVFGILGTAHLTLAAKAHRDLRRKRAGGTAAKTETAAGAPPSPPEPKLSVPEFLPAPPQPGPKPA
jgi:hypothetical protein